jgi:hypothetical protein
MTETEIETEIETEDSGDYYVSLEIEDSGEYYVPPEKEDSYSLYVVDENQRVSFKGSIKESKLKTLEEGTLYIKTKDIPITSNGFLKLENDVLVNDVEENAKAEVSNKRLHLIQTVKDKADWAFDLLDVKYAHTHKRGVSAKIADEWSAVAADVNASTPVIDMYALQKGVSREQQLAKVGRIVGFEIGATIKIEQLIGIIQDAPKEHLLAIEVEILEIDNIETIDDFIAYLAS